MKTMTSMVAVVAVAGGACAAPFSALSYEAGGGLPGIVGMGFTVSGGGFFVADGAGTNATPGATGSFNAANEYELDSYFALDGFGPVARNRSAGSSNNSTMTLQFYGNYGLPGGPEQDHNMGEMIPGYSLIVGPGSHIGDDGRNGDQPVNMARAGIGVAPPPVASTFAPNATGGRSSFDGVFIGRFTIKEGATLSGGMFFSTLAGPGDPDSHDLVLGGPAVTFRTHNGDQMLALRAYQVNIGGTLNIVNPSAVTEPAPVPPEPFGAANVFDLWVQVVPGPGAAWVLGLGVLGMKRRRP